MKIRSSQPACVQCKKVIRFRGDVEWARNAEGDWMALHKGGCPTRPFTDATVDP